MLTLNTTNDTLVLETRSTVSTDYTVTYVDHTSTTFAANSTVGNIAATGNTTILTAPAASTQREVKLLTVRNKSTTLNTTVVVKRTVSGTHYSITPPVSLRAGETLSYSKIKGFQPYHANGQPYLIQTVMSPIPSIAQPAYQSTGNLTTNKTIFTQTTNAVYLGKAPYSITGVRVRCNVTTAAATITWAEFALAIGAPAIITNPTLTPVGYTDVSAIVNSLGAKTIPIAITSPNYVQEYDDLWLLVGNQATTALILKSPSVADNASMGFYASNTATRPSLTLGVATAYTAESVANTSIFCLVEYT